MEQRIKGIENNQMLMRALFGLNGYLAKSGKIEQNLLHLIELRVSQLNGCAFCIDMHSKDLRAAGETEQRLYLLDAWRESPFYTERERAAFAWAEAVTFVTNGHVADEVFNEARKQFSEEELVDLTFAVTTINTWNRLNIAFRTPAGTYEPGQFASVATK
ncbi:MAG TPA: carboxymuconolactone decarboxylase family protein [Pyrinomonadaceae bacterium]|nr:carboxymuconolactone decarboxylase family protein [Pyrinomonadaceae bacterium]